MTGWVRAVGKAEFDEVDIVFRGGAVEYISEPPDEVIRIYSFGGKDRFVRPERTAAENEFEE